MTSRPKQPAWSRASDRELLALQLRQLRLGRPRRPALRRAMRRLERELQARDLMLRPHFWFSEEWFSPDGVPGIAIPFYLAHPRLERLERRLSGRVEGGNVTSLMRILRHEAGHAIDSAFRLHRRRLWRSAFGSPTRAYPDHYRVDPGSRRFVRHLDLWYAQAHPAEDFAETFAVWLTPRANWRVRYAGSAALRKLEAVDALMADIAGRRPPVRSMLHVDTVAESKLTLQEYYRRMLSRQARTDIAIVDRALGRAFIARPERGPARRAETFLRAERSELLRRSTPAVCRPGEYTFAAYDQAQWLQLAISRCRERQLWMRGSKAECAAVALRMMRRLRRLGAAGNRLQFTL